MKFSISRGIFSQRTTQVCKESKISSPFAVTSWKHFLERTVAVIGESVIFLSKCGFTADGKMNFNLDMGYLVAHSPCVMTHL